MLGISESADLVVGPDVQQERRYHAHCLLTTDAASVSLSNEALVQPPVSLATTYVPAAKVQLVGKASWIPGGVKHKCWCIGLHKSW